ncbi:MAG: PRC-barrel domain-containing protein [Euzebya sp.]
MTIDERLLRHASDISGQAVVTISGEDVAQVKDVLFDPTGSVLGFTLAGRGLLSGPLKTWLPWAGVHGFGADAIMIADDSALIPREMGDVSDDVQGDVTGDEVLTRSGTIIGRVIDAVLRLEPGVLDVVGYEVEPSDGGDPRFVPLPDTLAVNEGRLIVPDEATDFLTTDLAGFGASVDTFRERLRGETQ